MRAARVDANHVETVAQFRKLGCSVLNISQLKNCADIVVGKNGKNVLVEIKDGEKSASQRKLTKGEQKFHDEWKGLIVIVCDLSDVLALVKALEK